MKAGTTPILRYWDDKDSEGVDERTKLLFSQLEAIIGDVSEYCSFERATKTHDKGCSAEHRFYKGKGWLDCYRECLMVSEEGDDYNERLADMFRKYQLPIYLQSDIHKILETTNVVFYMKILEAQGAFIKDNINKIKKESDDNPRQLNMGAAWLIQRIYPREFSEVFRGAMDTDKASDDKARGDMKAALDSIKKRMKFAVASGNTARSDAKIEKIKGKIENESRLR